MSHATAKSNLAWRSALGTIGLSWRQITTTPGIRQKRPFVQNLIREILLNGNFYVTIAT